MSDKFEQIEKLAELLEKWYLTKDEFETEKWKILWNNEKTLHNDKSSSKIEEVKEKNNWKWNTKSNDLYVLFVIIIIIGTYFYVTNNRNKKYNQLSVIHTTNMTKSIKL